MAKNDVRVIDSNRQSSLRKRSWVRRHEKRGNGAWRDGVYVFHVRRAARSEPQSAAPAVFGAPGKRSAALLGNQWAQGYIPELCQDGRYRDPHGVMGFWPDQANHGKVLALDGCPV